MTFFWPIPKGPFFIPIVDVADTMNCVTTGMMRFWETSTMREYCLQRKHSRRRFYSLVLRRVAKLRLLSILIF